MLERIRPYLIYLRPVRWHFFGALVAGMVFGLATGAGLPLLTEKILPRLLGGGETLLDKELGSDREVTIHIVSENKGSEGVTPEPPQLTVGDQALESMEASPLPPGALRQLELRQTIPEPVSGTVQVTSTALSQDPQSKRARLWESILLASILPLAFIVRGIAGFVNSYWMAYCGQRVLEAIRLDLFAHLQRLTLSFFEQQRSGDLVSRMISDTQVVRRGIVSVSNDLIKQPITLVGAVAAVIYLSVQSREFFFLLIFFLSMPLCILPIRIITRRLKKRARKLQKEVGDVAAYVTDNLQAPREIRAFNLEGQQVDGLRGKIASLLKWQMKVVKYEKTASPLVEIVAAFGIAATVIYAGRVNIQLETMIPLLMALYVCYEPVKRLSGLATRWKRMEASLERIEELLQIEPDVEDPEEPAQLGTVQGAVSFEHVSFAYGEEEILTDVQVEVSPGEVVGIVGRSGAGKTTFVNLLLRFYDATRGTVKIDGHDVKTVRQADLRDAISFVPQEPLLFNATAKENILVGRPGASEEELVEAARRSRAHEFVEAMENGYDTMLGEKGTRLSGGQRQRIALARAFLKDAPILILDEGTSALDSENEALIQEQLMAYVKGKTVFIIAHRFATLEIVSRILVLHQGKLVGDGTNEELLQTCSLYRDLRELQMFS